MINILIRPKLRMDESFSYISSIEGVELSIRLIPHSLWN
jgi:hypothetical protein